jgi:hypothetical protein
MISPCDGCYQIFSSKLKKINVKDWKPNLCTVTKEDSSYCSDVTCKFNLGDEDGCSEWQFCDVCLADKKVVTRVFESIDQF